MNYIIVEETAGKLPAVEYEIESPDARDATIRAVSTCINGMITYGTRVGISVLRDYGVLCSQVIIDMKEA